MKYSNTVVIIVNYNVAELTIRAVESVLQRSPGCRVHVLDNASPNGDAAQLESAHAQRDWGDQVVLHLEDENHGFGRGNNLVFDLLSNEASPPDYVFLLNPDAHLKNDAISVLVEFLEARPVVAVAGARIEKREDEPVTAAFRFPSLVSQFCDGLSFGPVSRLFKNWQVPLSPLLERSQVDWVAGAALMFRFKTLREMNGFDPEFFLYYEEVELMHRINQRGNEVWYVPEAEVFHDEGASTQIRSGESFRRRRPAYWYHSWQHYFKKTHGSFYALCAAGAWILGAALSHPLSALRGKQVSVPLHFFRDMWGGAIRPLLGFKAQHRNAD